MSNSSQQTKDEALAVAKATQRPGQTKEQTKLIAAGIEKGISEYKKQHKAKQRQADKAKKKQRKEKEQETVVACQPAKSENTTPTRLPWLLLVLSWLCFIAFAVITSA